MAFKTRIEIKHIPTGTVWIGADVDYPDNEALQTLYGIVNNWGKYQSFTLTAVGNVKVSFGRTIINESICSLYVYDK